MGPTHRRRDDFRPGTSRVYISLPSIRNRSRFGSLKVTEQAVAENPALLRAVVDDFLVAAHDDVKELGNSNLQELLLINFGFDVPLALIKQHRQLVRSYQELRANITQQR